MNPEQKIQKGPQERIGEEMRWNPFRGSYPMNQSSLYGTYDSECQRRAASSPDPQHPMDLRDIPDIKKFDPDKLLTNEIKNGEHGTLAKIPKIRGRIARKDTPNGTYIQFIHDRVYLPEKKQSRNRKTIIGQSTEPLLQGMMLVNEKYYQFFDHQGNMIYKGEKPENEPDAEDQRMICWKKRNMKKKSLRKQIKH